MDAETRCSSEPNHFQQNRTRDSADGSTHRGRIISPCCMNPPHYTTTDPYLASFVLSQGVVLAGCTRLGPQKVEYRLMADCHLHALLRLYWSGVPTIVVPIRLFAVLRT